MMQLAERQPSTIQSRERETLKRPKRPVLQNWIGHGKHTPAFVCVCVLMHDPFSVPLTSASLNFRAAQGQLAESHPACMPSNSSQKKTQTTRSGAAGLPFRPSRIQTQTTQHVADARCRCFLGECIHLGFSGGGGPAASDLDQTLFRSRRLVSQAQTVSRSAARESE